MGSINEIKNIKNFKEEAEMLTSKTKTIIKNSITILYADNEQKPDHILNYLDKKKIKHKAMKGMKIGDWSFELPIIEGLTTSKFNGYQHFTIERKNSVEELAGNCSKADNRANFDREMTRACLKLHKFYIMIEDINGFYKIATGNYRGLYNNKAFMTSLLGFYIKYNVPFVFINPISSGSFILNMFLNYLYCYFDDRIYKTNRSEKLFEYDTIIEEIKNLKKEVHNG
jgi:hypothetical protein